MRKNDQKSQDGISHEKLLRLDGWLIEPLKIGRKYQTRLQKKWYWPIQSIDRSLQKSLNLKQRK